MKTKNTAEKIYNLINGAVLKRIENENAIKSAYNANIYFIKHATIATAFLEGKGLIEEFTEFKKSVLNEARDKL